ncbi:MULTISPECIES: 2Fe-2S iron-sulfur cluster-binding protein [Photobacterium]|nr:MULTISPECIES: 2Fe-2S iron-sulfur cluster-binding protein [Photobacterium]KJF85304.1 ferredoxin [Photobacterium leiognathi]KJF99802.1 ferredoxin [Photobacterium leiognathi]MCG3885297.1 2Fe-2S iron-sulfur cluster binding domain-containing protein [Photobacterium leiognathi]
MMYQVRLLPNNITFTASTQQTVLQAALDAGITFPNRCQVGACAMCMCRKTSGEVSYQLEPMLTEKEQAEGWIFTCQAVAESDLVLTLD